MVGAVDPWAGAGGPIGAAAAGGGPVISAGVGRADDNSAADEGITAT